MYAASGDSLTSGQVYTVLVFTGALCLVLGYLITWLSPVARKHKSRIAKLDEMLSGWLGVPAKPGFPVVPGIPQRLEEVENSLKVLNIREPKVEQVLKTLTHSVENINKREQDLSLRMEKEHGEKVAMLRQVQHDITNIRMMITYINLDRERKEKLWKESLATQGIITPDDTSGVKPPTLPTQTIDPTHPNEGDRNEVK